MSVSVHAYTLDGKSLEHVLTKSSWLHDMALFFNLAIQLVKNLKQSILMK